MGKVKQHYYRISVKRSPQLYPFLSSLENEGVNLSSIESTSTHTSFSIKRKDLRLVRKLRRKYGLSISIRYVRDIQFIRFHWISYLGIVLFICIPIIMSSFLWKIEFVQATPELEYDVTQLLEQEFAIKRGTNLLHLAPQYKIRQKIIKEFPEISWVFIERIGSKLTLEFQYKPDLKVDEKDIPLGDLIAKSSGIITHWRIEKGERLVASNQTVYKGDLLVSGTILYNEQPTVIGAVGEVFADYWLETKFEIPTTIETVSVDFVGWEVYGLRLPTKAESLVGWLGEVVSFTRKTEEKITETKLTQENAEALIMPLLEQKLLENAPANTTIKSQKLLHLDVQDDTVKGKILFLINENIAKLQPIMQGEGS